jgi:hypothetical protein
MGMHRAHSATVTVLLTVGCVGQSARDGGETTTAQTTTQSGDPSSSSEDGETTESSSSSTTSSEDSETDTSDEGASFVPTDDLYGLCSLSELSLCDEIAQDCPEGEKCVPFHIEGCSYPRCVPVTGDKPAGEPCTADDMAGDDCDADSWCYPGTLDLELPASCIAFCQGSHDDSFCDDPSLTCVFDYTVYLGALGCRPSCDPLMPEDCEPWERCTVSFNWPSDFGCILGGGVPNGDVCLTNQDCDSGACMPAESLLECAGESCCSPWCDIMAPSCAMGLECVSVEVGDPASSIGVCSLL